jgi:peroxiredoxin Q/BCP
MYKKAPASASSLRDEGTKAPSFKASDQDGVTRSLKDYAGRWVILYFYPKDDTPGCTKEACGFRDGFSKFKRAGIEVIGVSVDSVKKHAKFVEKYSLPFTLLSDEEKKIVEAYGVWGLKKFMGREYMGTNRVSYLIDPIGKIAKVYDKVKPDEHADEVLADVKIFQN